MSYKIIVQVSFSLIRPTELVQCIEFGGDGYLPQIFPFFFTCTTLMSSMVHYSFVQVTSWMIPKVHSFIMLLERWVFTSSLLGPLSTCWARIGVISTSSILELLSMCQTWISAQMGLLPSSDWAHGLYVVLGPFPPTIVLCVFYGLVIALVISNNFS